jgi:hypothetical protein
VRRGWAALAERGRREGRKETARRTRKTLAFEEDQEAE